MRHYRPLLLQDLNVRLPGVWVRRLRLNRHLPETLRVRRHRHAHSQLLLYLGGRGLQLIGEQSHPIRPGTVIFLPPCTPHAFRETAARRPLCLVLDVELRGAARRAPVVAILSEDDVNHVREQLGAMGRQVGKAPLRTGACVLEVLDRLLGATHWTSAQTSPEITEAPVVRRARRMIRDSEAESPTLRELARRIGYQPDYLNRLMKQTCGLTLGQLRAQHLLTRARAMLRQPGPIGDVADQLGFADQNYFARWFRRQTGVSPGEWRRKKGVTG